ncbi:MAG TPA: hypothetical protein VFX28_12325 [Methylomirabilota bacterium]|nr:hypothetical protein [Methylomirabilota bacterium]
MRDWAVGHTLLAGVALFVAASLLSLALVTAVIVALPPTYFVDTSARARQRWGLARWVVVAVKNLVGALIVLVGVLLSLPGVPGQGILTILIGLILLDLPGKRRLERRLIARPRVLATLNRLRARFGKPPLRV